MPKQDHGEVLVYRNSTHTQEIPSEELMVGDLIKLKEG